MAPVVAFGIFELLARKNHTQTLNPQIAFTSLALFALLRTPMSLIIDAIAGVVNAIGSLQRIGEYLVLEDNVETQADSELIPLSSAIPDSDRKRTHFEAEEPLELTDFGMSNTVVPGSLGNPMVVGTNVSAGWDPKKPFTIKDLNFVIPHSALTIIVGPVGSGKSTLLYSILGETTRNSGSIRVGFSKAAFCSQAPWITNETIRGNILGANIYDKPWYDQVVDACVLRDDLQRLPKGDQDDVGSNGTNLSGGQQARVVSNEINFLRRF